MPHLFTHKLILGADAPSITIGSTMLRNKSNMGISIIFLPFMDSSKAVGSLMPFTAHFCLFTRIDRVACR